MTARPGAPLPPGLADTPIAELASTLASSGLAFDYGAFRVRVRTRIAEFAALLQSVYAHSPFVAAAGFCDTSIDLLPAGGLRRWIRPQARIEVDGIDPFGPFPREQLLPHFEWGVNWAFANMMNVHLLLHSGTVEIDGRGVLLIARPGSGKSTLTAGLVARGARLLSDEFGVVRTADGALLPMAKPIALKNESIPTLREWSPEARIGPVFPNTRKGKLAHQAVPEASLRRVHEAAPPALVIFPQYRHGSERALLPVAQARAFMELAANSFNYEVLGPAGFEAVARLVERCACYRFEYASMQDAVDTVFRLCRETAPSTAPEPARTPAATPR